MKTILVPTDYSEVSENALHYAAELARFTRAKLILLHAYHVPVPTTEVPIVMISPEELERESMNHLKAVDKKLKKKYAGIETQLLVKAGFPIDEILSVVNEKEIDLIVMGVTGAEKNANVLLGSNTTSLMKKTTTPVLVIPKNARFKPVEKLVLAYDYSDVLKEKTVNKFKEFVRLFNAKVMILNVVKPSEVPAYSEAVSGISLENSLKNIEHTLFFPSSENTTDEINSFVDAHNSDWLVMIPHSYKSLSGLFHRSNTKRMAFHTHVPLLSLHD